MKLNCDLGEDFGAWKMPLDSQIMTVIDQANIACGFHAGDPSAMKEALSLAAEHSVAVGAHPSYPDLQGFGRRSMKMAKQELTACIQYQVSALQGLADIIGTHVSYVKPHGALYNDMMQDTGILETVMESVAAMSSETHSLVVQAHPDSEKVRTLAKQYGISLLFEAFSDRRYTDEGYLQSRAIAGAVLSKEQAFEQCERLINEGVVITTSGTPLTLNADTLCVHGDTAGAVDIALLIKALLNKTPL
ncbi:5-oxoprolinase subunit PxpA [Alteromonas sp. A079]|uniref:5-oxoprolinase subunit PxpA n=1 Tax=Alteromonas sp. A079 TaxID=3410268 RepID=UPI003B9F625C